MRLEIHWVWVLSHEGGISYGIKKSVDQFEESE